MFVSITFEISRGNCSSQSKRCKKLSKRLHRLERKALTEKSLIKQLKKELSIPLEENTPKQRHYKKAEFGVLSEEERNLLDNQISLSKSSSDKTF